LRGTAGSGLGVGHGGVHAALHRKGTFDRIDDTAELDEDAVAHPLDDTAMILDD
jgi:F420-0:gamma-glutamyl ligase